MASDTVNSANLWSSVMRKEAEATACLGWMGWGPAGTELMTPCGYRLLGAGAAEDSDVLSRASLASLPALRLPNSCCHPGGRQKTAHVTGQGLRREAHFWFAGRRPGVNSGNSVTGRACCGTGGAGPGEGDMALWLERARTMI